MSVKTAQYASPISQDTSRGPSQSIWHNFDTPDYQQDPGGGLGGTGKVFWDDFDGFPDYGTYNAENRLGQWNVWIGNNSGALVGTGADTTNLPLEGGVIGLKGGTTAIDLTLCAGVPGYRLISPASGYPLQGRLAFECRVALGNLTSAYGDLFVGLMDPGFGGTRITSAASLVFSATNTIKTAAGNGGCIGFWKRATTNPTDVAVVYNVNNGTAQLPGSTSNLQKIVTAVTGSALSALATTNNIATAGFVKLGFVFDPTPQRGPSLLAPAAITGNQTAGSLYGPILKFYVNGQLASAFLIPADVQASTFPSSFLVPTIGYRSGGTGDGLAYVDWVRCAQAGTF